MEAKTLRESNYKFVLEGNSGKTISMHHEDTFVGKATPDTFTNKTFDTAGTGNSFSINGVAVTANTGTGAVVRATSPTLVTPVLGVATMTSVNKVAITAPTTAVLVSMPIPSRIKPQWLMDEYALIYFRSFCIIVAKAPYRMAIAASVMMTKEYSFAASGNK